MRPPMLPATIVLNILMPGLGHLYASGGKAWGLFAFNLLYTSTYAFLYAFTGVPITLLGLELLLIWLYAIFSSGGMVRKYDKQRRLCPSCREGIKLGAVVCPHCQRDVDELEVLLLSRGGCPR